MDKKRVDRAILKSNRAQITIFIILGLIILFSFLFVIQLSYNMKKGQLQQEQEKVFTSSFKKESLRLFVENCLQDELEKGLILLGKQGRLWADQPGGTKEFSEGITGLTYAHLEEGGRIFYGITRTEYLHYPYSYPCQDETNSPRFCYYRYPNTQLNYGQLQLRPSALQNDLRRYLTNRTTTCVENYIKTNVSGVAQLEKTNIDLKMTIVDEGINVNVQYPLKFRLGNDEFFHLTTFDFFYPSAYNSLIDVAVSSPLEFDHKYIDFNYSYENLTQESFSYGSEKELPHCTIQNNRFNSYFLCSQGLSSGKFISLGLVMSKEEALNGDDIFIFKPAPNTIVRAPQEYELRIARQNRPPALNYINRSQCITGDSRDYDYLVIPQKDNFKNIDIVPLALDPDEDEVSYTFVKNDRFLPGVPGAREFKLDETTVAGLNPGFYSLMVRATDSHLNADEQDVKILIDRPMEAQLSLSSPYLFLDATGNLKTHNDLFSSGVYVISKEDPIFVGITLPQSREAIATTEKARLTYVHNSVEENVFGLPENNLPRETSWYDLPFSESRTSRGTLNDYSDRNDIYNLMNPALFNINPFLDSVRGTLKLSYGVNYCENNDQESISSISLTIQECLPHRNPAHPFAFPYEKTTFDPSTREYLGENNVNPFEATHSCCGGTADAPGSWGLLPLGTVCYESPTPNCKGKISQYTSNNPNYRGYVREQALDHCDGHRGNICGSGASADARLWKENGNEVLRCGDSTASDPVESSTCNKVNSECNNILSWGFVDKDNDHANEGWCHGTMGCKDYCRSQIVADQGSPVTTLNYFYPMNDNAKSTQMVQDSDLGVHCGCTAADVNRGAFCDRNFDGTFEGTCTGAGLCT